MIQNKAKGESKRGRGVDREMKREGRGADAKKSGEAVTSKERGERERESSEKGERDF